jgi:hypothetical protein
VAMTIADKQTRSWHQLLSPTLDLHNNMFALPIVAKQNKPRSPDLSGFFLVGDLACEAPVAQDPEALCSRRASPGHDGLLHTRALALARFVVGSESFIGRR